MLGLPKLPKDLFVVSPLTSQVLHDVFKGHPLLELAPPAEFWAEGVSVTSLSKRPSTGRSAFLTSFTSPQQSQRWERHRFKDSL